MTNSEIWIGAGCQLAQQGILEAERHLALAKAFLETVQSSCPHAGVAVYRDRQTGKCPLCEKQFMSKYDIDRIFVE